jgi:hypothetical protein
MKKVISILIPILLISILGAVDFDLSGEFRTRAAMYNDSSEDAGGHIDNRFRLNMDSQLVKGLDIHAMFEVGNITWGDSGTGGGLDTGGINVETDELYIDYLIQALDAKIRVGQQYWADHRGLVLDDFFSGVMLTKEDFMGMKAELGMIKVMEGNPNSVDDYNVFLGSVYGESPMPFGLTVMGGYLADQNVANLSILPYVTLQAGPATVDVTPFFDYQIMPNADDQMGMGVAVKADADLGMLKVGGDVLFAAENGITTLSPWYQNGLYIYGIGSHHDGVNLYWGTPYSMNTDSFISAVANVSAPMGEKMNLFAAAGMVQDHGTEINAGIHYQVVEDMMTLTGYGAYGMHDTNDVNNYVLGTTLQINF